jgi:hypothetical protein
MEVALFAVEHWYPVIGFERILVIPTLSPYTPTYSVLNAPKVA